MSMNKVILTLTALIIFSCKDQKTNQNTTTEQVVEEKVDTISSVINKETLKDLSVVPHHYICYTYDRNKTKRIWIGFSEKNLAIELKYEGQQESLQLKYNTEEYIEGGAHPTIIKYYDEIYQNKVNGKYKLTHSGNWDYVTYIRGKDNKEFNYTIDHHANPYGSIPCFK